jgi:hypothetical protein
VTSLGATGEVIWPGLAEWRTLVPLVLYYLALATVGLVNWCLLVGAVSRWSRPNSPTPSGGDASATESRGSDS